MVGRRDEGQDAKRGRTARESWEGRTASEAQALGAIRVYMTSWVLEPWLEEIVRAKEAQAAAVRTSKRERMRLFRQWESRIAVLVGPLYERRSNLPAWRFRSAVRALLWHATAVQPVLKVANVHRVRLYAWAARASN